MHIVVDTHSDNYKPIKCDLVICSIIYLNWLCGAFGVCWCLLVSADVFSATGTGHQSIVGGLLLLNKCQKVPITDKKGVIPANEAEKTLTIEADDTISSQYEQVSRTVASYNWGISITWNKTFHELLTCIAWEHETNLSNMSWKWHLPSCPLHVIRKYNSRGTR